MKDSASPFALSRRAHVGSTLPFGSRVTNLLMRDVIGLTSPRALAHFVSYRSAAREHWFYISSDLDGQRVPLKSISSSSTLGRIYARENVSLG